MKPSEILVLFFFCIYFPCVSINNSYFYTVTSVHVTEAQLDGCGATWCPNCRLQENSVLREETGTPLKILFKSSVFTDYTNDKRFYIYICVNKTWSHKKKLNANGDAALSFTANITGYLKLGHQLMWINLVFHYLVKIWDPYTCTVYNFCSCNCIHFEKISYYSEIYYIIYYNIIYIFRRFLIILRN